MLKIISAENIKKADAATIANEPVESILLMERAALKAMECILQNFNFHSYAVFCGPGNNGGDGLAIARLLVHQKKDVSVYILSVEKYSADFSINRNRLADATIAINEIKVIDDLPALKDEIIIDALFGTGLSKPLTALAAETVKFINRSGKTVVSIDLPSGMYADSPPDGVFVSASATLTFQLPKLTMMFPETGRHAGDIYILDIGLDKDFIEKLEGGNFLLQHKDIRSLLKPRSRFSHKGTFGHTLLIAGSEGKTGAALLSASAVLRSGAGSVTAALHESGIIALNAFLPEAMTLPSGKTHIDSLPDISRYDAIACGPGIGQEDATARMVKLLIQNARTPMVFDADALNILADNKTWLAFLHPGTILTPHPGEFERMAGKSADGFERMQKQTELSRKYQCYVLLKEHYSCLSAPDGKCYFNSTGNNGMSTAGSGDVLTGIIAGLLSQGYSPGNASLIGMYVHGLAGDLAAEKTGSRSLIASDIIQHLGNAFMQLETIS